MAGIISLLISIIILNMNGSNSPIKSWRLLASIKKNKKLQVYAIFRIIR